MQTNIMQCHYNNRIEEPLKHPGHVQSIKFWKCILERLISTPSIMTKCNFGAITNCKSELSSKLPLTSSYIFPQAHTMCTLNFVGAPPLQALPYLESITTIHRASPCLPFLNRLSQFPRRALIKILKFPNP